MAARAQVEHKRGLYLGEARCAVLLAGQDVSERAGDCESRTADGAVAASRACGRWHRSAGKSSARDQRSRHVGLPLRRPATMLPPAHGDERLYGPRIRLRGQLKRRCVRQRRGCDRLLHDGDRFRDGYGRAGMPAAIRLPTRAASCRVGGGCCRWSAGAYASK